MRLSTIFRIRGHVRAVVLKIRRVTVLVLVLGALFTSLVVGKNVLLGEVRKEIRKTFAYDSLKASYFPPALVLENVRTLAGPTDFRAKRVKIEVSFLSLLRNHKALSVRFESPEVRLTMDRPAAPRAKARRPWSLVSLPFVVEEGIIEDGSVVLDTGKATLDLRGLRARVTQRGVDFTVRATAERTSYTSRAPVREFSAALNVSLSGRGDEVKVERLTIEGPDVQLRAEGRVRNLFDPEIDLDLGYDVETAFLDTVLHMPFDWKGKVSGAGTFRRVAGDISCETSVETDVLELCRVPMGRIRGTFGYDAVRGGRLDLRLQKPGLPAESLSLTFLGGRVEGLAEPIFVDPVFSELRIPWPVRSPAWGSFSLEHKKLAVDAAFRDASLDREERGFAFKGDVQVGVDFATSRISIRTPNLESNFGRLDATADIDLAGDIDAKIRGPIFDVKETREFVQLVLAQTFGFAEIRGAGYADVQLSGPAASPDVLIKATLSPGGFDQFDAAFVETEASLTKAGFDGRFDVDDPDVKGRVRVRAAADATEVDVRNGEGELAKIFHGLGLPVALTGRVAGDFQMVDRSGAQEFSGVFTSNEVSGYGQKAGRVSGRFDWKDGVLAFPELDMDFYGGRVSGRLAVGTVDGAFDTDLRGEELDFGQVVAGASGRLSLSASGRGVFGQDRLPGLFAIKDMLLSPLAKTEVRGEFLLGIAGGRAVLDLKGGLVPGENPFEAAFDLPFGSDPFSGVVKGTLRDLDIAVPWKGARGELTYQADIRETEGQAHVSLAFDVAAPLMPLPGFPYPLTDFTAAAKYSDEALTFTSITGKLGGGVVKGGGEVALGEGGIASLDLRFEAADMILSPMDRIRAQVDASLRLLKDTTRFVFEGDLLFKRLTWRRELYEAFSFSSGTETESEAGPSFFDGLSLNLRLRADDNVAIENSLGKFTGRFNLSVTGSLDAPVLLGDIDISSGDFYFQDRSFRVINGRLSFVNPVNQEPFLDFRGETYVKDYRVTLSMSGPVSRLKPEFSSSPPLPPEEVLSLLALGEAFKRTFYSYSGDRSTALNTASLLTFQIADQALKRTGGLFSLDRFRIDPYIPERAPGGIAARLTVGKKISRNVLFIYSTSLANSTVQAAIDEYAIFRVEWDISRRFTLVGGRDDRGRLSIDVKFRKRF